MLKKFKKTKQKDIQTIVTEAHALNRRIKDLEKEYITDLKKDLDEYKKEIKKYYEENFKGKSKSVEKYEIKGRDKTGAVVVLSENQKVDSRLFFDALNEDVDVLLDLIEISQKQAKSVLPGDTVDDCMIKDMDKDPRITFK